MQLPSMNIGKNVSSSHTKTLALSFLFNFFLDWIMSESLVVASTLDVNLIGLYRRHRSTGRRCARNSNILCVNLSTHLQEVEAMSGSNFLTNTQLESKRL